MAVGAMEGAGAAASGVDGRLLGAGAGTSGAPKPTEGIGDRPPSTIAGWLAAGSGRGCVGLGTGAGGRACAGSLPPFPALDRLPNTSTGSEFRSGRSLHE